MTNEAIYWVWLQQVLKYGSHKIRTVNLMYKNIKDFYSAGLNEWILCGCFTKKELNNLNSIKIEDVKVIIDKCKSLEYDIICYSDEKYPGRLKNIPNPPCVIYTKGIIPNLDDKICISIVGTRRCTVYGAQMAFDLAYGLSKSEAIVVSGGAIGVDKAAHKGALQAGGKTIAVLGCGINCSYLMENASLRNTISKNGAVISEYPPDYPAYPSNFPIRNRIISGLSMGTVVIEAGEKSGSIITANLAAEQGRDVFVVPVDMHSSVSKGTTALIRDGAQIVTCSDDLINEYSNRDIVKKENLKQLDELKNIDFKFEKSKSGNYNINNMHKENKHTKKLPDMSCEAKNVYEFLKQGKHHIDEICVNTKIPIRKLLGIMTELEMLGLVKSYSGRMYGRVDFIS